MSGISGILSIKGKPVDLQLLKRSIEVLAHRGPDRADIYSDQVTGLGYCLLFTTPESFDEKQPWEENGLVIVADARIDNRDELMRILGFSTQVWNQISDYKIILEAYHKWGKTCPVHLLGDFAFAFLPGFLVGYSLYLSIHYMVHAFQPPKSFLRHLWVNHSVHHYKNGEVVFGVSSPLWDYVYRTMV